MISIESNEKEVRVTIPRSDINPDELEAALGPLRFASSVLKSQMTKEEAFQLGETVKSEWWKKNQDRFGPLNN